MAVAQTRSDGPMALFRAFALLRLLAEERTGLTLSALSESLNVPKSSLSATLKCLTEQGFLIRKSALYFLGSESYSLASAVLAGRSISQIARPYLERTMESSGETVLLAILDPDMRNFTNIDIVESPKTVRYSVPVGTGRPLYATACGRLFLAYQSATLRQAYLESVELERLTEHTITDPSDLEEMLVGIRQTGVSMTLGDYSPDVAGFSAPIFGANGEMVAALAIGAPVSRGQREQKRYLEEVRGAAQSISKTLGYFEASSAR